MKFGVPSAGFGLFAGLYVGSRWRMFWGFCGASGLCSIQNGVNVPYSFDQGRRGRIVVSRVRVGHSRLVRDCLSGGDQQPECIFCDCPLTLHRVLLECSGTLPARNLLLDDVQTVRIFCFAQVSVSGVLIFLRECAFCIRINRFFAHFILNFYGRRMGR